MKATEDRKKRLIANGEARFAAYAREYGDIVNVERVGDVFHFVTADGTVGIFDLVSQNFSWPRSSRGEE